MQSRFAEVLIALDAALRQLGVGWYLFGAQAAILYGAERLTADVDVTIHLGGRTTRELVELLAILRARGRELDLELVRSTLSLLEQALDQSDLMPLFVQALKRAAPA